MEFMTGWLKNNKLFVISFLFVGLFSSLYLLENKADANTPFYKLVTLNTNNDSDYITLLNKMADEGYVFDHKKTGYDKDSIIFRKK